MLSDGGRLTVNERRVARRGTKGEPASVSLKVDGRAVHLPDASGYFILYKPAGVVTTLSDPQGRGTISDWVREMPGRLFPVGRLDYDAEGALILTDDGSLAHRLSHPKFGVRRTYLAKVKGAPEAAALERLRAGVRLEDGPAKPVSVELFRAAEKNTWLPIVAAEGRSHLIKQLCAAVGYPVLRLFRPSYGGVGVAGVETGDGRPLPPPGEGRLVAGAGGKTALALDALFLSPRPPR